MILRFYSLHNVLNHSKTTHRIIIIQREFEFRRYVKYYLYICSNEH